MAKKTAVRALPPQIGTLAEQINAAHAACEAASKTAGEQAWECGRLLIVAKAEHPGDFQKWCRNNVVPDERQCRNYMQIARMDRQRVADMSMRDALNTAADHEDTERIKREVAEEKAKRKGTDTPDVVYDVEDDDTEEVFKRKEQNEKKRIAEAQARCDLALRLIDVGFKALAKQLHSDKGGNDEAMARLNDVRKLLTTRAKGMLEA